MIADTSAAFLLVAQRFDPMENYLTVIAAVICIYWAGMILNDVNDIEVDREQRPNSPLPAGRISVDAARQVGGGLLFCGVLLALLTGLWAARIAADSVVPGILGIALAVAVVLYDGPLKRTIVAPLMMGGCRCLSFLLGASAATLDNTSAHFFGAHVLIIALGMGVYIVGVTIMARHETTGGQQTLLRVGAAVLVLGLVLVASGPMFAPPGSEFYLTPTWKYSLLIALLSITGLRRDWQAINHPQPKEIQVAIKSALLTLIPLAAAIATLGAGTIAGVMILALLVPAMGIGRYLRVT